MKPCIACGCTDDNACPGGCSWVSHDPPLCSACVDDELGGGIGDAAILDDSGAVAGGRCPGSPAGVHKPIWTDEHGGHCACCRQKFAA